MVGTSLVEAHARAIFVSHASGPLHGTGNTLSRFYQDWRPITTILPRANQLRSGLGQLQRLPLESLVTSSTIEFFCTKNPLISRLVAATGAPRRLSRLSVATDSHRRLPSPLVASSNPPNHNHFVDRETKGLFHQVCLA